MRRINHFSIEDKILKYFLLAWEVISSKFTRGEEKGFFKNCQNLDIFVNFYQNNFLLLSNLLKIHQMTFLILFN